MTQTDTEEKPMPHAFDGSHVQAALFEMVEGCGPARTLNFLEGVVSGMRLCVMKRDSDE